MSSFVNKNFRPKMMITNQKQQKMPKRNNSYGAKFFDYFWEVRAFSNKGTIGGGVHI